MLREFGMTFRGRRSIVSFDFKLIETKDAKLPIFLKLTYFGSTPFEPDIPTELRKTNSEDQFSIVGQGEGGYGEEFQKDLGGNRRREQFTIVMLTYDRNEVLIESLKRLDQLPFLNKVLVIWNNPEYPGEDIQWPDIGVEIVVIKTKRNSLNNRFFPYAEIETDAILQQKVRHGF